MAVVFAVHNAMNLFWLFFFFAFLFLSVNAQYKKCSYVYNQLKLNGHNGWKRGVCTISVHQCRHPFEHVMCIYWVSSARTLQRPNWNDLHYFPLFRCVLLYFWQLATKLEIFSFHQKTSPIQMHNETLLTSHITPGAWTRKEKNHTRHVRNVGDDGNSQAFYRIFHTAHDERKARFYRQIPETHIRSL